MTFTGWEGIIKLSNKLGFVTYNVHLKGDNMKKLTVAMILSLVLVMMFCLVACNPHGSCSHVYDNDCDTSCNKCGETRIPSNHIYDNACDTACNVCNATRSVGDHDYDSDGYCTVCGYNPNLEHLTFSDIGESYIVVDANENYSGALVIPSVYNGKSVTAISEEAFKDCVRLTGITIPDSVTTIGYSAFHNCKSLTNLVIPNSVTIIENGVFEQCESLTSLVIPDSVTAINAWAFADCYRLVSVIIGDSVTVIRQGAFYCCENLTSVTIGESVEVIGADAFRACGKIVEVYNKSNFDITLSNAYGGISFALNIYTEEGGSKLSTDSNGFVIYDDGADKILVNYVGNSTSVTLPSNITTINKYAFVYCDILTNIVIPDSVTFIGEYAFAYCKNLTNITIGNNVSTIEAYAFESCESLESATFEDPNGWSANYTNISLTNASTNATYLKDEYKKCRWYKNS